MITDNKNDRVTQVFTVQFTQQERSNEAAKGVQDQSSGQPIAKGVDVNVITSTHISAKDTATINKYY